MKFFKENIHGKFIYKEKCWNCRFLSINIKIYLLIKRKTDIEVIKMYEKDIGRKIKELRNKQGISQEELAKFLDKSGNSTVSKIESGTQSITASELKKLAVALKSTPNEILGFRSLTESPIYYKSVTNKQIKLKEFKSSTTRFEWIAFFILMISPIIVPFIKAKMGYIFLFILAVVILVVLIKVFLSYFMNQNKNSLNIQTDVNNNIVYVHKWKQSQLTEYRRSIIFASSFGTALSFLYIVAFSNSIDTILVGSTWVVVLITFMLFIPPMVRLFCSLNLNPNIDVDYKEIKDNSLLFYLSLLINITSLLLVAFYTSYQKSINPDIFKNDLLFIAITECIITFFVLFAHTKYLDNYEIFVIEKESNQKTKIQIHSKSE
jgi:transcriptional regulator with XRE-family HTH domain